MKKKHIFSNYPVKGSETYECVKNSGGETQCKEEQKKQNNAQPTIVKIIQNLSEIATTIAKSIETTSIMSANQTTILSITNTDTETS